MTALLTTITKKRPAVWRDDFVRATRHVGEPCDLSQEPIFDIHL